jgi:sugar fermentation stimulation protein A
MPTSRPEAPALVDACFVARPNRFVVRARLADGRAVEAHLGDPGRLRELLVDGARLRLRPAPPDTSRATRFTVSLILAPDRPHPWVSVETTRANDLAEDVLARGAVRGLPRPATLRREVRHGRSRFDFALDDADGVRTWVEVKSVTLVEGGIARFPDAPTARGARHLRELTTLVRGGARAAVLFVVPRDDARVVVPHAALDPEFASALSEARGSGVLLRAWAFQLDRHARATSRGPLPVRPRSTGPRN